MIDEALRSLLLRHRSAELDAEYAADDAHPLDEPDEWGDSRRSARRPQRPDDQPAAWRVVVV